LFGQDQFNSKEGDFTVADASEPLPNIEGHNHLIVKRRIRKENALYMQLDIAFRKYAEYQNAITDF
jgi:hypothetical protein